MEIVRHRPEARVRRCVRVRGVVQGVGFRPAVFRLATSLGLGGFVRNDAEGVWIELEGAADAVARFLAELPGAAPAQARISSLASFDAITRNEEVFRIEASDASGGARALVPVDLAPCDACLRELLDPANRRYRYPFINCTACGPRYTIVRDLPYDRDRTTMARFPLCAACRDEYEDPRNRRFHAEPNACPTCGPRVRLVAAQHESSGDAAVRRAAALLAEGRIVAVKGAGGFLLACDATNEVAVARLRDRKRRPHKPFAIMGRDLETLRRVVVPDLAAERALASPSRPIVLMPCLSGVLARSVAPGLHELGVFLPPTPLQQLLLRDGPSLQVMTSGNVSDEPIARTDDEALEGLRGIADAYVVHDREIHTRADDSVVRIVAGEARSVRRARGFVPEPVALVHDGSGVLAVGAGLKNTVCLVRGREAFVSQHLGDLGHLKTREFFAETVGRLSRLLALEPRVVAHDLHPDYESTRWAASSGLPRVPVQHHHAHVASCMAENGVDESVLGVAFDGTGCGPDGSLWGGEFFACNLREFRRLGHLRALRLPGGEAAIREPWRLAASALVDAGEPLDLLARVDSRRVQAISELVARGLSSPPSTGAGRWFDAVAALCGVRDAVSYEGQAAVELEAFAIDVSEPYQFAVDDALEVDLRPTVRAIARDLRRGVSASLVSGRFHETLAAVIARVCRESRERTGLGRVALSGGCFQNRRLVERTRALLENASFEVLLHRRVPPNDGGVSLGQAAIAACRGAAGRS